MSIFMKMTIHVDPYQLDEFMDALSSCVIPMNEEHGWMLQASFVEVLGPLKPTVIHDIWELKDINTAVTDWMAQPFANDPRWIEYSQRVRDIIVYEDTVFMVKKFGRLQNYYADEETGRSAIFTEVDPTE